MLARPFAALMLGLSFIQLVLRAPSSACDYGESHAISPSPDVMLVTSAPGEALTGSEGHAMDEASELGSCPAPPGGPAQCTASALCATAGVLPTPRLRVAALGDVTGTNWSDPFPVAPGNRVAPDTPPPRA
jgi:hypothetical protein